MKFDYKLILKIFAMALAYYVTGVLGLQLAVPPGFATSFWPPAGISLAGVLVFGYSVWPGLLVGAFFVNIIPLFNDNNIISWSAVFLPAFLPAAGSVLQALVGAKLIKRYAGYPSALNEERTIMKFLLLGGPLACTVSATVAVVSLCVFGWLPWSAFAFTWGTWWVGDSIGVMTLAPLLVTMMSDKNDKFSRKNFFILMPSLVILTLTIFVYVKVSKWEQEKLENDLKSKSEYIANEIEERLDVYLEVLRSIEGLFASSEHVEKEEFRKFVKGPIERYKGLHALAWDVRVKHADRAKYEKELKNRNIQLKEVASDGRIVPASKMDEYVFPWYIEPEEKNAPALGFNLYSNENRKKAIQLAISTGQPSVTSRVRLIQDETHGSGLLIFVPIYEKGKPVTTSEEREKYAAGVVAGAMQFDDFIGVTLAGFHKDGINFKIVDLASPDDERTLYSSPDFDSVTASKQDLNWGRDIRFANRSWKINFKKNYAALLENRPWQAWFVLAAGLMFSGLFTAFLMMIIGRTSRIEELVDERTKQLAEAEANMITASKMSALGEMAGGMAHEINTPLTIINLKVSQIQNELIAKSVNIPKVDEGLNKIEDTVARIAKIIRGLRYFARDTKNDPFIRVQVSAILEDTLYLCTERFRYNGIVLNTPPYPKDLYIECRPTEISQVLLNLLNNACDAVLDLPEKWISIQVIPKSGDLEIRICDSGKGISAEVQEKIMQPFFTTKPFGKGTGLGLSISKGIIESHKGTLTIDNKMPNTCFVVTLPIHQNRE